MIVLDTPGYVCYLFDDRNVVFYYLLYGWFLRAGGFRSLLLSIKYICGKPGIIAMLFSLFNRVYMRRLMVKQSSPLPSLSYSSRSS